MGDLQEATRVFVQVSEDKLDFLEDFFVMVALGPNNVLLPSKPPLKLLHEFPFFARSSKLFTLSKHPKDWLFPL